MKKIHLFLVLLFISSYCNAQTWSNTASMTTTRANHTATLLPNGKVLFTGGYNGDFLSTCELYDPATGTWTSTASMTVARYIHTATLLPNGKVLVTGGTGNSESLNTCELYDPATGTWTSTASMTAARYIHTATLLPNGKVLVTGGAGNSGNLNTCELYDPASGTWTDTGSMTVSRYYHTATLLPNGKVLVTGGYGNGYLNTAELYDPVTGTWASTAPMIATRYIHTATLLPNGKVLIAGGLGLGAYLNTCELYDPTTGVWTSTGSMTTMRYYHGATLLSNGKVLITGGDGSNDYLNTAELYDPATGIWASTNSMIVARYAHSSTLLPNNKVLIIGGFGNSGVLNTCELYIPVCTVTTTPTFTQVAPICNGATLSALPTTSNNGITGTWSPALNNTATTEYTFTPEADQCATTTTMTIEVYPVTPNPIAFAQVFYSDVTVANLVATGSNLQWYDVASGGLALASSTPLITKSYYVSQTLNGCESERTMVAVTAGLVYCYGVKVSDLITAVAGINVKVYSLARATTPMSLTSLLTTKTYYFTETEGSVVSEKKPVEVVVNSVSIAGLISGASGTICNNTEKILTLSSTHRGNVQWQSAPLVSGTFGAFTNIVGATGDTLDTGNLIATTYFRAVVTNSVCSSKNTTSVKVTVRRQSVAGTISGGEISVCSGINSTKLTLNGYVGTIQWEYSKDNINFVSLAPYGKYSYYYAKNLTQTTYYRAVVTKGVDCTPAISESVAVNVSSTINTGTITGTPTIPYNASTILTLSDYDIGTTFIWKYSRYLNGPYYKGLQPSFTNDAYTTGSIRGAVYFKVIVSKDGCSSSTAPFLVTGASVGKQNKEIIDDFNVIAYPNPFSNNFKLGVDSSSKAPVEVKVYDMLGRLVEVRIIKSFEIDNQEIGNNCSSGVYNLKVTQEANTKNIRVIKQ